MGGNREPAGEGPVILDGLLYRADAAISRWIAEKIPGYRINQNARCIGVIKGERLVAAVTYENYNGVHVESCIAAEPRALWATDDVLRAIFTYPFVTLGCKAISVSVPASNLASLNLATKLGFEPEAFVRYAAPDGSDLIILKMFRNNCEWIDHG